ncbi:hypothetical protein J6590_082937 [Homalodisca vitripennis]|nr:hypothetical protein J6590_082937 [Homalodisca vitripennis]
MRMKVTDTRERRTQFEFIVREKDVVLEVARTAGNSSGYREGLSCLFISVMYSVILDGCEICGYALRQLLYRQMMAAVQGNKALRIMSA